MTRDVKNWIQSSIDPRKTGGRFMDTISMEEILAIYQKVGASPKKTAVIRTTLNKGTLRNRLVVKRANGRFNGARLKKTEKY